MRSPEFNAYIAPARLHAQLWRLALGVLIILFVYAGFLALVVTGVFAYATPIGFFGWMLDLKAATKPVPTLVMLFTFTGLALGPVIAAPACHYRSPGTLFGPLSDTLRGFFTTVAIAAVFFAVFIAISGWLSPAMPNLPLGAWLDYLPWALPLILVQTGAEELVFRGYLQQQLAARFHRRVIWMGLPAALFAAGHWSPAQGGGAWLMVGAALVFALIAADLVEKTGSLGAAIGLHFVNNIFAVLVVAGSGTITGLALYVTPAPTPENGSMALMLGLDTLALLILWRILRFALAR